jgi:hypothetical protein
MGLGSRDFSKEFHSNVGFGSFEISTELENIIID